MAATLTRAILNDLEKGQACIKVVTQTDTLTDTTFADADKLFTSKDSFAIVQADPTRTEIKIDQYDETIDTSVELGEFNISGSIPSSAIELFDYFYPVATIQPTLTTGITGDDGVTKYTEAKAYNHEPKEVNVTMFVESQSKKSALVFTHVRMTVAMNHDSVQTNLFTLNFTGTVLKPRTDGAGSFVVLKSA